MSLLVLVLVLVVFGTVTGYWLVARRDAWLTALVERDREALDGEDPGVPAVASLDHLQPRRAEVPVPESPYRRVGEDPSDERRARLRRRAHTALCSARWLLMSAVDQSLEAEARARRGDRRGADQRTMEQNRAECEALQCVFEAEDCLGIRIVRDPGEPRRFARFYGQASHLVVIVDAFCEQMFRPANARPTRRV
ncbi:MAG: hypothetical protein AAGF11_14555 [Myxococcota bacterium]